MKTEVQYSFNDGEYMDDSYLECVYYMVEQDMPKEDIVGTRLEILTLAQCIPENIVGKMQDLLHDSCEDRFDYGDYLEQELSKVWKALRGIEMFYPSCEHYIVTEEDYNEAIKDYGRLDN